MERIKFILGSLLGTLSFMPALAFAQGKIPLSTGLGGALIGIRDTMNFIVPMLIGIAVIVFLWGVLAFILHANDPDKRKEGRGFMLWAIIGIVVMVSVWGLVGFVQKTFNLENSSGNVINGPRLP